MKYKGEIFRLCVMMEVCLSPSFDLLATAHEIHSILLSEHKDITMKEVIEGINNYLNQYR